MTDAAEVSQLRPTFHSKLDEKLDIEAAASILQQWTDKLSKKPVREWEYLAPASKELYKLLAYKVAEALAGYSEWRAVQEEVQDAVELSSEKVVI